MKTRWYHKLFYRLSMPYRKDIEQEKRVMLHRGIGIGMKHARLAGLDYYQDASFQVPDRYCDQCGVPVLLPDALFCRRCGAHLPTYTGPYAQVPLRPTTQPLVQTTGPARVLHVPAGTLARAFRQAPGGTHTKTLTAIGKAQLLELMKEKAS